MATLPRIEPPRNFISEWTVTILMLLFSARSGAIAQRIGPRLPLTVGPLVIAASALLLGRVEPGSSYLTAVLPGTLVLGVGLVINWINIS